MTGFARDAGRSGEDADVAQGVVMFASRLCGYCRRAHALLVSKGVDVREILVDGQPDQRRRMERLSGARTVPQIFIHGRHVGGCDQLYALERAGRLDALLSAGGVRGPEEPGGERGMPPAAGAD
jgi:glutaredoxin 3